MRLFLRALGALVAGATILAGFAVWLLMHGPISLDALTPYVAKALTAGTGVTVTIDHTLLSIGEQGKLELLARDVHLNQADGEAELTLPQLELELSLRAGVEGVIAPTRIVVEQPVLRLDRAVDGSFHLGVGALAQQPSEDWGAQLVSDLARVPDRNGPLGYLTEIVVRGATLTVDDRSLGILWRADSADLSLQRRADRVTGNFDLFAGPSQKQAALRGDFTFLPLQHRLVVSVAFTDLRPAAWALAAPAVADLAVVDLPVSGTLHVELDPARFIILDATGDLHFGSGALKHEALVDGALPIAGGSLAAGYDAVAGRINLGGLTVDLGGPKISASGTIDGVGADLLAGAQPQAVDIALALAAQDLPVDDLPRRWPAHLSANTREWVTQHMHDGTIDTLQAELGLHLDLAPGAAKPAQLQRLDGTMSYHNLSIEYFRPLPLVRGIDGAAHFNRTEIDFAANEGTLIGVKVSNAAVRLYQLDTNDEQAQIDVTAAGPLADALSVLDTPPLGYARDLSLDPRHVAGNFSAVMSFALPIKHELELSAVDFHAAADLDGVAASGVMFGRDLSDGSFKMTLDHAAMQLDGTAAFGGVPMSIAWTQSLNSGDPVRTRYAVQARLDGAARKLLGLDYFDAMVDGDIGIDLVYTLGRRQQAQASVTLDLNDAKLAIPKLSWSKASGAAAMARLTVDLSDEKLAAIRDAVVKGGGMDAHFSARFDNDGLRQIELEHLIAGDTNVSGNLSRQDDGGWRLRVSGDGFDASGLAEELDRTPSGDSKEAPLEIIANLGRLVLGPRREARAVSVRLLSDGVHWQRANVDAQLTPAGKLRVRFGENGDRGFNLTTDDFGALLQLLDVSDNLVGGQFDLSGVAEDRAGKRVLRAHADGSNYRMIGAPLFARVLSLASFSGIGALLSGEGIPFSRLSADIVYGDGKISADNLRAYGGAIGVNASGTVDRQAGTLDVSGTLVPAYTLNSVLGNVPVLGNLLLGGEGQGIFGANFRVAGTLADPHISVNALSTFAPGVLRRLFLFDPGNPGAAAPPAAKTP